MIRTFDPYEGWARSNLLASLSAFESRNLHPRAANTSFVQIVDGHPVDVENGALLEEAVAFYRRGEFDCSIALTKAICFDAPKPVLHPQVDDEVIAITEEIRKEFAKIKLDPGWLSLRQLRNDA